MTVTYKDHEVGGLTLKLPVLHKVVYAKTVDRVQAQWQISYKDYIVNKWLEENCKHGCYHSPGYLYEKFIEFECNEEAFMFALRFS
jgi:hypothetical protein